MSFAVTGRKHQGQETPGPSRLQRVEMWIGMAGIHMGEF